MRQWNLDARIAEELPKAKAAYVPPTGTRLEQAMQIMERCKALDASTLANALAAEEDGDAEACWMAMATRAENARFMERLQKDIDTMSFENPPG